MALSEDWPENEQEVLGACPVCASPSRDRLLTGLHDMAFLVAPGRWTLWRCRDCGSAYLDPRPDAASIVRAYARYYTHDDARMDGLVPTARLDLRTRLAIGFRNSWLSRRYGVRLGGSLPLGWLLAGLLAERRRRVDYIIRQLPPTRGQERTLLDAGCGSGSFVNVARQLGYKAVGLDFDAAAVAQGRAAGLDIRQGSLPGTGLEPGSFDYITVSHVLEHLHDPVGALREFMTLLKPGGCLWITQPNLGSCGFKEFGAAWRGLEPPRHLTLFDAPGLQRLLEKLGYTRVTLEQPVPVAEFYYRQSLCQKQGVDPYAEGPTPGWNEEWAAKARAADEAAARDPALSENLTISAWKPA